MVYKEKEEIFSQGAVVEKNNDLEFKDFILFKEKIVDNLVDTIILGEDEELKKVCFWIAYKAGLNQGVFPSTIYSLYKAKAEENLPLFTVPAINLRTLTYDLARAVFRAAKKINAGAFIFEIAKSEIGYTFQRPAEYASLVILAGMKENYKGSIFIQGDHFQIKAKNYYQDKEKELAQLKDLIKEAIRAGFYNIDIDTSTLVDLSKDSVEAQQEENFKVCAQVTRFIREIQPPGVEVTVGGEIGEIGGRNSTPSELHAFMRGYLKEIGALQGISKMAIQTGTTHGGVVLPDGSIARVKIDFDTLRELSKIAKEEYKLAGCVQHGASTLPREAFHHFPQVGCCEIHLATQFQNIVYEYMPLSLKEEIYKWLEENCAQERKPDWSDDQFIYKTRKKALGPFKKKIYSLPKDLKDKISHTLEEGFLFLFNQLKIQNTKEIVEKYVPTIPLEKKKQDFLQEEVRLEELEGAD